MTKSVYIMATEPVSGQFLVALGMLQVLQKKGGKVAYFRPVIADPEKAGARDSHINLALNHFGLDIPYEDTFAFTLGEVKKSIHEGRQEAVMDAILAKYKKLEAHYDFVVCVGTDNKGADLAFQYEFNASIADMLGCPVLLVANGRDKSADDLVYGLEAVAELLQKRTVDVPVLVVAKATASADEQKTIASALSNGGKKLAFVLPDSPGGQTCCIAPDDKASLDSTMAFLASHLDGPALLDALAGASTAKISPKMFEFNLIERAARNKMRVVLPEGEDDRILKATAVLARRGVAEIILLGKADAIAQRCKTLGLDFDVTVIDPETSAQYGDYVDTYVELRKAKGITREQAQATMKDPSYFGTMMVHKNHADGMVSGAINTTAHTIRPAFEFIKAKPGTAIVSSTFLMCMKDKVLVFGDCAVNPNPTPEQLAGIAISSAHTARVFGVEPKVAMLSYSTGSSGKGADVDAVKEATALAQTLAPELALEGPLQYDAAIDMDVARTKLPNSKVAGQATVFIFPNLNTGNNTYKAVQRAAGAVAIGPVLQGLNKPVNDLSRGCTVADIINTVAITAVQAQAEKGL